MKRTAIWIAIIAIVIAVLAMSKNSLLFRLLKTKPTNVIRIEHCHFT